MRDISNGMVVAAVLGLLAGVVQAVGPPSGSVKQCPVDAAVSGTLCVDKYEASVRRVPAPATLNKGLVSRIQQGKATAAGGGSNRAERSVPGGTEFIEGRLRRPDPVTLLEGRVDRLLRAPCT